jgi:hypothetical protein
MRSDGLSPPQRDWSQRRGPHADLALRFDQKECCLKRSSAIRRGVHDAGGLLPDQPATSSHTRWHTSSRDDRVPGAVLDR